MATEALSTFPEIVIQGARQVGKSTFAQLLAAQRAATLITLDDEATRSAAEADPLSFLKQAAEGTLIIDEIQRVPNLILAIKASIDRKRPPAGSFSQALRTFRA